MLTSQCPEYFIIRVEISRVAAAEMRRVGVLGQARRGNNKYPSEKLRPTMALNPSNVIRRIVAIVEVVLLFVEPSSILIVWF
jgi:hypothetical protein